ncbi:MAG: polysaccharide deacetylase family protein [Bacteroidota bacterium]
MYFHKTPFLLKWLYPGFWWSRASQEKIIYLTFDDGPIPEVTEWVLETLGKFGAKATFFCVGDNVRKNPEVFQKLLAQGHGLGNHTFNHLNGWQVETNQYLENILQCHEEMRITGDKLLFRPPYGRIKRDQVRLVQQAYQIVMWDVLTGDFDAKLLPTDCLKKAIQHTRKGSIIIFHDSLKAEKNLRYALPRYLEHFTRLGYRFETLQ